VATFRGARRAPGPTTERARNTKTLPTSFPTPAAILRQHHRQQLHPSGSSPIDGELLSFVLIGGGFVLIAGAWQYLHAAQRAGRIAEAGPYAYVRHPQYAGFILILSGFLVQWPTLLTLLMYPVLVAMYLRLARQEEADARVQFGAAYDAYAKRVPAFIPRLGSSPEPTI
jgi:protein-S-isoprenylcysteine O-methyltransferase Ste14